MNDWFVVWCRTGSEDRIAQSAKDFGAKAIVPKGKTWYYKDKKWALKEKIYIPGYVFISCYMNAEIYYKIRNLNNVLGWLGTDSMWPTKLKKDEISHVLELSAGTDPKTILENVKIDRHRRKGSGTITLCGEEKTISFAAYEEKQPDENKVD